MKLPDEPKMFEFRKSVMQNQRQYPDFALWVPSVALVLVTAILGAMSRVSLEPKYIGDTTFSVTRFELFSHAVLTRCSG